MSGIRWSFAQDLAVHRIGELQDKDGVACDDEEVLHTLPGNRAVVIHDKEIDETYVFEGTPDQMAFLAGLFFAAATKEVT
jgi:hypothetical protein